MVRTQGSSQRSAGKYFQRAAIHAIEVIHRSLDDTVGLTLEVSLVLSDRYRQFLFPVRLQRSSPSVARG